MYENKTEHVILKNMLDKVTTPVAKVEGTIIYDALSPVANELAKHYIELDTFIKRAFIQTSHSSFLDLRASEYGLYRKQPTKAAVMLTFTGTNGIVIPQGFLVQTVDGKQFRTMDAVSISSSGTAEVLAQATETNIYHNVPANTVTQIPLSMVGVSGVTNAAAATGGTDTETDNDFRTRVLNTVQNPGSSGNINHYVQWAMEIDGVGAVKVIPLWNGNGTVKVAILDSNRLPAATSIVDSARVHIEAERPIGATVTVESGTLFNVTVACDITLDGTVSMAVATQRIRESVESHFKEIAFKQNYISYPKMSAIILTVDGVADHTGLTLNGVAGNLDIPATSVAVLNTLSIT